MGAFKRMKDMKDMLNAAPDMVAQARQLGAQAQEMAAAQQAAVQAQQQQAAAAAYATGAASGPDFGPIAGVALDRYVAVSKGVAQYGYDQAKLPEVAASHGISAADWDEAFQGWNDRIKANPAVAQRFNQIYRGV